jgi:hypothetical protein
MSLVHALELAGLGQVVLALASTTFPRILGWPRDLAVLRPMLRRMFWIYAGYIFGCNLAFGLLSFLGARWLVDRTPLAAAVTGFIALYWIARLGLQAAFDRADMPAGARYRVAEAALVSLFLYLAGTYALAFAGNVQG